MLSELTHRGGLSGSEETADHDVTSWLRHGGPLLNEDRPQDQCTKQKAEPTTSNSPTKTALKKAHQETSERKPDIFNRPRKRVGDQTPNEVYYSRRIIALQSSKYSLLVVVGSFYRGFRLSLRCDRTQQSKYNRTCDNHRDRPSITRGSNPDQAWKKKNPAKVNGRSLLTHKNNYPPSERHQQRQSQRSPPATNERQHEEVEGKEQELPPDDLEGTESLPAEEWCECTSSPVAHARSSRAGIDTIV
jgi:hypothetical protein